MSHLRPLLGLFAASTLLVACSESSPPVETGQVAEVPQEVIPVDSVDRPEAPVGRLPQNVAPSHYRLELTIDPKEARFSGRVAIDVTI